MRVRVDEGRCQGHARCAALAPELFDLDADGYSFVVPGREKLAEGEEHVLAQLAVDNCPEQAISIEPDG